MHSYCPECFCDVDENGFDLSVYVMIAETFAHHWVPICLYDPHIWNKSLYWLEANNYIITTEAGKENIYARPNYIHLEEGGIIFCNQQCEFSNVDFNAEYE